MREGLAAEVPEGKDTMKTLAVELVKNEVKHAHEEVLSLNASPRFCLRRCGQARCRVTSKGQRITLCHCGATNGGQPGFDGVEWWPRDSTGGGTTGEASVEGPLMGDLKNRKFAASSAIRTAITSGLSRLCCLLTRYRCLSTQHHVHCSRCRTVAK